jgi:hypothetical protein
LAAPEESAAYLADMPDLLSLRDRVRKEGEIDAAKIENQA